MHAPMPCIARVFPSSGFGERAARRARCGCGRCAGLSSCGLGVCVCGVLQLPHAAHHGSSPQVRVLRLHQAEQQQQDPGAQAQEAVRRRR